MSDSRAAANEVLQTVLAKLDHLNLHDNVFGIYPFKSSIGGSCDVFRGKLHKTDGTTVETAVKRVRESMNTDLNFAKVAASPGLNGEIIDLTMIGICKRDAYLGEACPCEHSPVGRLYTRRWFPSDHISMG